MTILFCNTGWMKKYEGKKGDSIINGGSHPKTTGHGYEACNFSGVQGNVYGYVPQGGEMNIKRLGAGEEDESISGITVVWTATLNEGTVAVGWYKNATVYKKEQTLAEPRTELQKRNKLKYYRVMAAENDAKLFLPEDRNLEIPRIGDKGVVPGGCMGQSSIWYADQPESEGFLKKVLKYLNTTKA